MRRIALIAVALAVLFIPDSRPTKALPMNGIERYYYANACDPSCRINDPGMVGDYLGERINSCSLHYNTIQESDLVGYDNWKEEWIIPCEGGYATVTWYHGGYQNWTPATPRAGCYCEL